MAVTSAEGRLRAYVQQLIAAINTYDARALVAYTGIPVHCGRLGAELEAVLNAARELSGLDALLAATPESPAPSECQLDTGERCNPFIAKCGAQFCSPEEAMHHDRQHQVAVLPASEGLHGATI